MPENEAFIADMQPVANTLSRIPRDSSATAEDFAAAFSAFSGAVKRQTASGYIRNNREAALQLFDCGYSLVLRLDDSHGIPSDIHEEAWEAYEGYANLLGINLAVLHGEGYEQIGGKSA